MKDNTKKLKELNELLDELKPYSGYLIELIEGRIEMKEFRMYKYRNTEDGEAYYNEVIALKKIVNVLNFILK